MTAQELTGLLGSSIRRGAYGDISEEKATEVIVALGALLEKLEGVGLDFNMFIPSLKLEVELQTWKDMAGALSKMTDRLTKHIIGTEVQ
jgi:hypothetical protein